MMVEIYTLCWKLMEITLMIKGKCVFFLNFSNSSQVLVDVSASNL